MIYRPSTLPHPKMPSTGSPLMADLGWLLLARCDLSRTPFILALAFGWSDIRL